MPVITYRQEPYPTKADGLVGATLRLERRSELAAAEKLATRAEQLGFPLLGASILDLAIQVQESALNQSWRQEIAVAAEWLSDLDVAWRRATLDRRRGGSSQTRWVQAEEGGQTVVLIAENRPRFPLVLPAEFDRSVDTFEPIACDLATCRKARCEDHWHSVDYHSADCSCGRTEANCTQAL